MAAASPSKTRAVPSKWSVSMPATFTTEPFGASEPLRMAMPPWAWIGLSRAWMHVAVRIGDVHARRGSRPSSCRSRS